MNLLKRQQHSNLHIDSVKDECTPLDVIGLSSPVLKLDFSNLAFQKSKEIGGLKC